MLRGDDGDDRYLTRKFVDQCFVLTPGIESVHDNLFLAGVDESAHFLDGAFEDEILAFLDTHLFTELFLALPGDFDAGIFHHPVHDTTPIDFRDTLSGEIVNNGTFAASGEPNRGDYLNFCLFFIDHSFILT